MVEKNEEIIVSKKLTKHGNSLALVIEKPLLNLLKINEKTELEISVEGGNLIIRPAANKSKRISHLKDRDIEQIAEKIMDKYEEVFKKLSKS
jgi:antitoxin component of MazEF toxin-antitoxin module